jgi:hypothetical protein
MVAGGDRSLQAEEACRQQRSAADETPSADVTHSRRFGGVSRVRDPFKAVNDRTPVEGTQYARHSARIVRDMCAKGESSNFAGLKRGNTMEWQRTSRFMRLAAAAAVGGACWISSADVGVSQESAPPTDPGQSSYDQPSSAQPRYNQSRDTSRQTRDQRQDTRDQGRDTTRQTRDQGQETRDQGRDTTRRGRDELQDRGDQSRDAIGEARDDMRDTSRQARDQFQDARGQRRDQSQDARDQGRDARRDTREDSRDTARQSRDDSRDQGQRDFQTQRDFSRDAQRDDFPDQQERDFSRDDAQRDQFRDQRDQFDDRRDQRRDQRDEFTDRRDQSRDERDQFDDRRDAQRDDRDFESRRADQRGTREDFRASSRTQVSRAADVGLWFERDTSRGLVISDIASSGPITRFGFREGDQLISINNTRVNSEQHFIQLLTSPQFQNQRVQIWVWRSGQQVPVWVEPWTLLQTSSSGHARSDSLESFGVVLDDRYQLPVVWKVLPRSPAYYAGVRSNDVIVVWNGQHVNDPQELEELAQQTEDAEIQVQVSRNRQLRQLTLEMDGQSRTALRPGYDEGYGTTDAIGAPPAGRTTGTSYQQRTYTQPGTAYVQPGTTYVQPGTTYIQPAPTLVPRPADVRPGILPRRRGM